MIVDMKSHFLTKNLEIVQKWLVEILLLKYLLILFFIDLSFFNLSLI